MQLAHASLQHGKALDKLLTMITNRSISLKNRSNIFSSCIRRRRRLRYFGHLQRMDTNIWSRRVNDYVVPGILPRGRPQLRWSDVITTDLKGLNIRQELDDEGVEWRKVIMSRKIQLQTVRPTGGGHAL